jgi:pyridoxamine 5'-phosphate oxidase
MHDDPIALFLSCRAEAVARGTAQDGVAAVLATATPEGIPSARYVLVKEVGPDGFAFYTNYESRKARELDANPRAALCTLWNETEVQFRVEGVVERATLSRSDAYFAGRPRISQLGAWASAQSRPIASREALMETLAEVEARFADGEVPRPAGWGGYLLRPERIEHWVAGAYRLHDRFVYTRSGEGWTVERLAP